jgi:hypothetical protein
MLAANAASPPLPVAKARLAPGATSWTSWSIARPSSVLGAAPSASTFNAHRRQVTRGDVGGRAALHVVAVADDADALARAVKCPRRRPADAVGFHHDVGLVAHRTGEGDGA